MTKPAKTYHEGAHNERTAIMAKIERELKAVRLNSPRYEALHKIKQFLLGRHRRYHAKQGGL